MTGEERWRAGGKGAGPGEFLLANSLVALPQQRFGVIDPRAARMVIFDSAGKYYADVTGPLFDREVDDLCATSDDDYIATRFPDWEVVKTRRSGRIIDRAMPKWPDTTMYLAPILRQTRFARVRPAGSSCLLYATSGNAFAYLDTVSLTLQDVRPYAEPFKTPDVATKNQQPLVQNHAYSGTFVVATDSIVYVLFAGRSALSERVIDAYRHDNGQYLWSIQLPRKTFQFDIVDDVLFMLERAGDYVRIASYRLRREGI